MVPVGREFNQALALSFSEKGNILSLTDSSLKFWNRNVEQISKNSLTCTIAGCPNQYCVHRQSLKRYYELNHAIGTDYYIAVARYPHGED